MALPYWRLSLTISLLLLAWRFSSNGRDYVVPVMTFDGSRLLNLTELHEPISREEIIDLIRHVKSKQQKLRVLGSGHSLLPLALSEEVTLTLHKYRGLVGVNLEAKQVTVKAGTTLEELNAILDDHGLALGVFSAIGWQTVAGAIMTATHGTGIKYGNLATLVVSFEMVTPNGEVMVVRKGDNLFDASITSLGLLGVVTQMTFQAETAFNLKEVTTVMTLQECIDQLHNITESHEYARFWINMISNSCLIITADRISDHLQTSAEDYTWLNFKMHIFELMQWIVTMFPNMAFQIMSSSVGTQLFFTPRSRIGRSHEIFLVPFYESLQTQQELAVEIGDCQKSLKILHEFVHQKKIAVNSFVEVRTVRSDEFWLSPNYGRNSCHITQILYRPSAPTSQQYFYDYFDLIGEFKPRPHWGKNFQLTTNHLPVLYPKFKEFLTVKKRLDPSGILTNKFLGNLFKI